MRISMYPKYHKLFFTKQSFKKRRKKIMSHIDARYKFEQISQGAGAGEGAGKGAGACSGAGAGLNQT